MALLDTSVDRLERIGNRLPDPTTLFIIGTALVIAASWLAATTGWEVHEQKAIVAADGSLTWELAASHRAVSLLSRDGIFWLVRNLVKNFTAFPPLGVVLVGMLGIGVAERSGLIASTLKGVMAFVPTVLLTPAMLLLGTLSSLTLDAGYVVLPPLAAALYRAAGRSPLAGLAAVFAGVAAGFNANFFLTGLDPMLAEFATAGAQIIEPTYVVSPDCNWWFMIASTFVITATGWLVTARFVEPRLAAKTPEEGGPVTAQGQAERPSLQEWRGLRVSAVVFTIACTLTVTAIQWPAMPLYTHHLQSDGKRIVAEQLIEDGQTKLVPSNDRFERWVLAIVPLLFLLFLLPGIAYGASTGSIRNDRDLVRMLVETMAAMAPIIVLAFFAAQFLACFKYSGLDIMLALSGGAFLTQANLPTPILLVGFIFITMLFNLLIGSMSAKYAMFAPVFIPMFMLVGISPELTQAAYRIGDSVTNIITPLNPYMVIILVFMRQLVPKAGMGTLITTMLPYTIAFTIVWIIMLLCWVALGIPLGPHGGLRFGP